MNKDIDVVKLNENEQTMWESQKENWIEYDDMKKMYNDYFILIKPLLKKEWLNKKEYRMMNLYVLLSCLFLIPPLRSLNYTEFKIRDINKDWDNYMDAKQNKFVFNVYKNWNTKGKSEIDINKQLKNIILKWMNYNSWNYLLNDTNGNKLNQVKLNVLLNNFFNKRVSTWLIRHAY